ncbi:MAG: hypothetical protein HXS40_08345 [Theionarchaea archaeon]|nr:hypothetical protein [Theionarchaea archaeon]
MEIEEALNLLNITESELWNLLDNYEYFPSGKVVARACQIEKNSLAELESIFGREGSTSRIFMQDLKIKSQLIPSDSSRSWLYVLPDYIGKTSTADEKVKEKPIPVPSLKKRDNGFFFLGITDTSNRKSDFLSLLQYC